MKHWIAIAVVALLLAGCGSESSDDETTSTSPNAVATTDDTAGGAIGTAEGAAADHGLDVDTTLTGEDRSTVDPSWSLVTGFTMDGDAWAVWLHDGKPVKVFDATKNPDDSEGPPGVPADVKSAF